MSLHCHLNCGPPTRHNTHACGKAKRTSHSANAGESRVVRIIKTDEKTGERVAGIFNFGNKACAASLSQKDTVLSKRYFNGASVEAKGFVIYTME